MQRNAISSCQPMKMKKYFLFLTVLLFSLTTIGQYNFKQNALYVELGGAGLITSVNLCSMIMYNATSAFVQVTNSCHKLEIVGTKNNAQR